jgi:hypothetical protein
VACEGCGDNTESEAGKAGEGFHAGSPGPMPNEANFPAIPAAGEAAGWNELAAN